MFTAMQERAIREAIAYECDRQHVGADRREFLYSAYCRAVEARQAGQRVPSLELALSLAGELEPVSKARLRLTPVTFADGGSSAEAHTLPRLMPQLFAAAETFTSTEDDVRYWVKELLWAHPLEDGNGRLGFLLYNWLRDSLLSPAQMPYFFGEAPVS